MSVNIWNPFIFTKATTYLPKNHEMLRKTWISDQGGNDNMEHIDAWFLQMGSRRHGYFVSRYIYKNPTKNC